MPLDSLHTHRDYVLFVAAAVAGDIKQLLSIFILNDLSPVRSEGQQSDLKWLFFLQPAADFNWRHFNYS